MRAVYVESSAVVAWLFGEPEAGDVIRAMNDAEVIVTSLLTITEAERAIHRALAQRLVKEATANKLRGVLAHERSKWITMSLTENILTRAGRAFPVEPVKTLDAIHLATAMAFTGAFADLAMLALDRRVSRNATALGLAPA